jgi:hypothetical protein
MLCSHRMKCEDVGFLTKNANQLTAKTRLATEIQLVTDV